MTRRLFLLSVILLAIAAPPSTATAQNAGGSAAVDVIFRLQNLTGGSANYENFLISENTFSLGDGTSAAMATQDAGPIGLSVGESFQLFANGNASTFFDGLADADAISATLLTIVNDTNIPQDFTVRGDYSISADSFGSTTLAFDGSALGALEVFTNFDPFIDVEVDSFAFEGGGLFQESGFFLIEGSVDPNSVFEIDALADTLTQGFASEAIPEPSALMLLSCLGLIGLSKRRRSSQDEEKKRISKSPSSHLGNWAYFLATIRYQLDKNKI